MSENIEKAVPTEESPKTKESETSAPAATDNVVLYPVADISAAQETTETKHFLIFQTVLIFQSMTMPTMFISVKTTLSTAPNSTHFQIQREKHL